MSKNFLQFERQARQFSKSGQLISRIVEVRFKIFKLSDILIILAYLYSTFLKIRVFLTLFCLKLTQLFQLRVISSSLCCFCNIFFVNFLANFGDLLILIYFLKLSCENVLLFTFLRPRYLHQNQQFFPILIF